jgi:hypothetical protein
MLSVIGVDLSTAMALVVVVLFVFTRVWRSNAWMEVSALGFMLIMTAALVVFVFNTGVGFDVVPVICLVAREYTCNPSTSQLLHCEAGILASKVRTEIAMNHLFGTWALTQVIWLGFDGIALTVVYMEVMVVS